MEQSADRVHLEQRQKTQELVKEPEEIVQRSFQFLPTGANVKLWARYGEAIIKIELVYVRVYLY